MRDYAQTQVEGGTERDRDSTMPVNMMAQAVLGLLTLVSRPLKGHSYGCADDEASRNSDG